MNLFTLNDMIFNLHFWRRGPLSILMVLAALSLNGQTLLASWDFTSSTAPTSFLDARLNSTVQGYSGGSSAITNNEIYGTSFNQGTACYNASSCGWTNYFTFGVLASTNKTIKVNRIRFKIAHGGATGPLYQAYVYNAADFTTARNIGPNVTSGPTPIPSTSYTQVDQTITEYTSGSEFYFFVTAKHLGSTTAAQNAKAYIDDVEIYGTITCTNPPVFSTPTTTASCSNNGKINLAWTGGVSPYTITGGATTISGITTTSRTLTGLASGTYNLTITDANSCTATTTATVAADNSCRCSDSLQLVSLYNATNGANWTVKDTIINGIRKRSPWILSDPINTWYGVWLNTSNCVNYIDLDGYDSADNIYVFGSSMNLQGVLLNLNLPNLEGLVLSNNKLTGAIPLFDLMPNLSYLILYSNQLSGNIPKFGQQSLTQIRIYDNPLITGPIPNFNLPNLLVLFLFSNNHSGAIPAFESLTNLRYLGLYNNKLSGAIPNFNMPNLESLSLDGNPFNTTLPIFDKLISLQSLSISSGLLQGSIPKFNLPNLKTLGLWNNQLNDTIPNFNLPNLEQLILYKNSLTGKIPPLNLPKLTLLQLQNNILSGCIPREIKTNCTFIGLNGDISNNPNLATQSWANYWGSSNEGACLPCASATASITGKTSICGTGSTILTATTNLVLPTYLWSTGATTASITPSVFGTYSVTVTQSDSCIKTASVVVGADNSCRCSDSLQLVSLYNATGGNTWTNKTNWLTSNPISTWYGVQTDVNTGCVIHIDMDGTVDWLPNGTMGNNLTGNLPTLNLPNVQVLNFTKNRLTGKVQNFNFPNLKWILFAYNQFSDTIPNFNLPNLEYLVLGDNLLSGKIPNFSLSKLLLLSLGNNQLSGEIPIFSLPELIDIRLHNNRLTGSIPNFNFPKLIQFILHTNQLTGCIPRELRTNFTAMTATGGYIFTNPNLATQSWQNYWNNGEGACAPCPITGTITGKTSICGSGSTTLTATTNAVLPTYAWSTGATTSSITTSTSGTYGVTITQSDGCVATASVVVTSGGCRCRDSLALVDIFRATGGESGTWTVRNVGGKKSPWVLSEPMENWHGVFINTGGCVSSLDLSSNGLDGTLPTSVGNLTDLLFLSFGSNRLSGSIPSSLGNLNKVTQMDLYGNRFSGIIPQELGNMTAMVHMNLSSNKQYFGGITGTVPTSIGNLTNLRRFYVSGTNIDSFPLISALTGLGDLFNGRAKLTFDDILPYVGISPHLTALTVGNSGYYYIEQDSVFTETTYTKNVGDPLSINLGIDAAISTNIYKWYKNGVPYQTIPGNNTLSFANLQATNAGTYTCKVTNPNAPNLTLYSRKAFVNISCIPASTPSISSTQPAVCVGETARLTASGTLNNATNWQWYTSSCGGTPIGSGASIDVSPTTATSYYVRGEGGGCPNGSCSFATIIVKTTPSVLSTTPSSRCGAASVNLQATASAGTLNWYAASTGGTVLGTGTTFTTPTISMTTTYYVEATNNGCTSARTPVVATITAEATTPSVSTTQISCSTQRLSITSGSLNNSTNWQWYSGSCGGTAIGSGTTINVSPTTPTTYFARGEGGGCPNGSCGQVAATVNVPLSVNITANPASATICNGSSVQLTANITAGAAAPHTYQWSNGATTVNTSDNPTADRSYTVTVTNANGCSATSTQLITVNAIPAVTSTTPNKRCGTGTVNLQATASVGTLNWYAASTGGVSLGTGASFTTPSISTTTTYYVEATNGSCTAPSRTAVVATVNQPPVLSTPTVTANCNGTGNINLTWTSVAAFFTVRYGIGTPSMSVPNIGPTNYRISNLPSGTYAIVVEDDLGCSTSTTVTVPVVTPLSNALIINAQPTCGQSNGSITANATGGKTPYSYAWSNGATTAAINNLSANTTTAFTVTVTDAQSCQTTQSTSLTCVPAACVNKTVPQNATFCEGRTYTLPKGVVVNAAGTYRDSFKIGNCDSVVVTTLTMLAADKKTLTPSVCGTSYALRTGRIVTASGMYKDTVQNVAVNGCDSIYTYNLTLNSNPTVIPTADIMICEGRSTNLVNTTSGTTYTWNNGLGTGNSKTVSPTTTTTYIVTITNSANCSANDTMTVFIIPKIRRSLNISICSGQTYTFFGRPLSMSNVYKDSTAASNGCDSVVTLVLVVNDSIVKNVSASINQGQTYTLPNGATVSTAGTYRTVLRQAVNGCDSVVYTALTVVAFGVDTTTCRYKDSLALIALYDATGGDNWRKKTNWKSTRPLNEWYGIYTNTEGCVTCIDLDGTVNYTWSMDSMGNNLRGQLPTTLGNGNLAKLERLIVNGNQGLTGTLPTNFGNMPELLAFWANDCRFNTPFPNSLWSAPKLEDIDLTNNALNTIPPSEFSLMPKLSGLLLPNSGLYGTVPSSWSGKLWRRVQLEDNKIDSLPNVSSFSNAPNCNCHDSLLNIKNNRLTFDDILPTLATWRQIVPIIYAPQDSIFQTTTYTKRVGDPLSIDLKIDGALTSNRYVLWKDGARFRELGDTLFVNNFTIPSVQARHAGMYEVRVTNPNALLLELVSRKITVVVNPALVDTTCQYKDSLELAKFNIATRGTLWTTKWDLTQPLLLPNGDQNTQYWKGITQDSNGCVIGIELTKNNLQDTLISLNLPYLEVLRLDSNALTGRIPNFNLPELRQLNLAKNTLTSKIPYFTNIPKLEILNLSDNQLSDTVPNFILRELIGLYLGNNQLSGQIPNLNLPKLQDLYAYTNRFTISTLPNFNLPELLELDLSDCLLNTPLINFTQLPKLEVLVLHSNQLTGAIPPFNFPNLKVLQLNDNRLSNQLPELNVPQLTEIQVNANLLTGCFPASYRQFCAFPSSKRNFSGNQGLPNNGNFFPFCNGSTGMCQDTTTCRFRDSLVLVTLYDSTQGDRWLNTVQNVRKWKTPNIPITNWYGVYTNAAGCVVGLDFDGVDDGSGNHNSGNLLRGTLPDAVFNMSALKTLFLSGNPMNVLPNAVGRLNNLTNLHVENCGLTALPDSLWALRQLEGLNISRNAFNAPFPSRIGQLTNVSYLLAHNSGWANETAGSDALGALQTLKKLGYLDASANNFSGTLSPTIWTIDSIGVVILRNNRLTSLGTATPRRAVLFDVQDNRLTSALNFNSLPIEVGTTDWGGLRLKGNQLTFAHILPSMGIASRANRFFYNPQDSVFITTTLTARVGDPLSIKLNFDDTVRSNSYQWRKIRSVGDTIVVGTTTANALSFNTLQASDAGVYEVHVTNSIATQLTLYSRKVTVVATPNTSCRYKDSLALVDIYRATNMQNATPQYRWILTQPMTTWKGVALNASGCVECLDLDGDAFDCNGYSDNPPGVGLSGVFPSAIGRLTSLYRLHLRGNRGLTGPIPDSIRYLTNLAALYIDSTGLTGALPDGFQYLTALEDYTGYNTRFNAPIPNFFRLIKKMDTFDMTNTGTSGKFPVSLANVDSLRRLYLGNNNMTDTIPIELSRRLLHRFDISNNRFDSLPKLNLVEWQLSFVGTPYFYVQGNKLTFDDILPNLQGLPASFLKNYAPQDPIFQTTTYTKNVGDTLTIDLGIDAALTTNKYVWIKNGVRIDSSNKNTKILRGVLPCDAGTYTVEVTNSAAPLLTLRSRTITIIVNPITQQTRNKTICYGQKDTLPSGQIVAPTASATYPETLRNRANTCDSAMITTNLTVLPLPVVSKMDSFCFGKNYPLPQTNRLVTTAGVFSDTIAAVGGCKTRYTTTLTYKTDLTRTENITICTGQSYNLIDSTVNTEGSFTRRKSGLVTCDSVITTNLTVLPIPTISKIDSFCEGKSYNLPQTNRIVRATGVFRDTVRNANNCIIHYATTLTYRQNLTRTERITICSGQFYKLPNDSIVTTAGVYTSRKTTTGCDSVITTTLIVNPKPTAQIVGLNTLYCWDNTPVVLQGQPTGGTFKIDGATASNFTPSVLPVGNHTVSYIYRAASGCFDTTIQTMRLGDFGRNTINRTICPGDSVTILGKVYHQRKLSSVDTLKMAAASGCDSIITVQVAVHQRVNALDDDYEMLRNTSNILLDVLKNDIYPGNLFELTVKKQPNIGTIELLNNDKYKLTFTGKVGQDIVFSYLLCHLNCANECDTALVRIKIKDKSNEFDPISGGVSPNGDGKNDKLDLPNINWGLYPDNTIEIFNRFGQKVYVAAPYKRDWEGQNTEGSSLPSGDYFIILRLDGGGKIVLGNVYLAR